MFNEVSTSPFHPSNHLPEWQKIHEGERDEDDTHDSLMNIDQSTPTGKRKQKSGKILEVETQQSIGYKMRFLVGYDKGKTFATITTPKEALDYQFQYPGRNKCHQRVQKHQG